MHLQSFTSYLPLMLSTTPTPDVAMLPDMPATVAPISTWLYDAFTRHSFIPLLILAHFLHCFWESYVAMGQMYGIVKNITTNESMHWPRYFYLHDANGKFHNFLSSGMWNNVREFFLHKRNYMSFPVAEFLELQRQALMSHSHCAGECSSSCPSSGTHDHTSV